MGKAFDKAWYPGLICMVRSFGIQIFLGGLENFEVVYFPGPELFWNFSGGYPLGGPVSLREDLVLFGP